MSNLKAAAELVRRVIQQCDEAGTFPVTISAAADNAAWKLARAYLAEHPTDDDSETSIDDEWLDSVAIQDDASGNYVLGNVDDADLEIEGDIAWIVRDDIVPIKIKQVKTRGDVRRLAKALGVTLGEKR